MRLLSTMSMLSLRSSIRLLSTVSMLSMLSLLSTLSTMWRFLQMMSYEHAEPAEHNELAEEHNELAEEHNELAEEHNELPELAELTEHEEDAERRGLRRKRAMARMQIQRVRQTGRLRRLQCVRSEPILWRPRGAYCLTPFLGTEHAETATQLRASSLS
jgi:hypothetical protein